jgi:Domain of unknown function (DUF4267)
MAATIGFYLSGVIAIAIIFIGCRFLLASSTAAAAYGVPAGAEPHLRAYLSAKGIRDIASGLFAAILIAYGSARVGGRAEAKHPGGCREVRHGLHVEDNDRCFGHGLAQSALETEIRTLRPETAPEAQEPPISRRTFLAVASSLASAMRYRISDETDWPFAFASSLHLWIVPQVGKGYLRLVTCVRAQAIALLLLLARARRLWPCSMPPWLARHFRSARRFAQEDYTSISKPMF